MPTSWERFKHSQSRIPALGLTLDVSRVKFDDGFFERMSASVKRAFEAMDALEKGAIANPDEKRMVGHYWLRAPELAPTPAIAAEIHKCVEDIKKFAADIHRGTIKPATAAKFTRVLSIGIGGSALGPMFVADALGNPSDPMQVYFIDNTDPDGIARTLQGLAGKLGETLCIVTSKSGGTPEPRNGMLLVAEAYSKAGLDFTKHVVAVTMLDDSSGLYKLAVKDKWLKLFPMFDWVGGRTSELSAVGLVPAALQGFDIDAMLAGAKACDEVTRKHDLRGNPAAQLALMWYQTTDGKGKKDMVVLPYKDRLLLFSRYLQQLVMESLGKQLDLQGKRVDQGISVYGNKGSTDQHAYVQQLRDGVPNFFTVFIRVLESGGSTYAVDPGVRAGDYLHGFLLGTRAALYDNDRESITITVPHVDARIIGGLIALFERAVGFYGNLVGINAYHQPGVEAGKKAAASVLALQAKVAAALTSTPQTAEQIAAACAPDAETVYLLLEHLAANGRAKSAGDGDPGKITFCKQ